MMRRSMVVLGWVAVAGCAPDPLGIPGPAGSVTRGEALEIAERYARLEWTATERHVWHGRDPDGLPVHTPDIGLARHGIPFGEWEPGVKQTGMVYQWGGFDTPRSFLRGLERGKFAGDVMTPFKRAYGDAVVSRHACGIDCSGFVSRCWRLPRPVSTAELASICDPLAEWNDLRPGDILLVRGHVMLFAGWQDGRQEVRVYEAAPKPAWRVCENVLDVGTLRQRGYRAFRYRWMKECRGTKQG